MRHETAAADVAGLTFTLGMPIGRHRDSDSGNNGVLLLAFEIEAS